MPSRMALAAPNNCGPVTGCGSSGSLPMAVLLLPVPPSTAKNAFLESLAFIRYASFACVADKNWYWPLSTGILTFSVLRNSKVSSTASGIPLTNVIVFFMAPDIGSARSYTLASESPGHSCPATALKEALVVCTYDHIGRCTDVSSKLL